MLDALLRHVESDDRILAVILYGSQARGDAHAASDHDVCLVMKPENDDKTASAAAQLDYFEFHELDVRIYQRLPLYVRQRILADGEVLLVKDEDELYEIAFRTIRAFEDFRPFYLSYLEEVANG